MEIDQLHQYCNQKPGTTESFPFDEQTLVFKVMGRMFALVRLDNLEGGINLKCDPQKALTLRAQYPDDILPGYHMNKTHWNTVRFHTELPNSLIFELIDHSYNLVVNKLHSKLRDQLSSQLPPPPDTE